MAPTISNDIVDLTDERVDNLSALLTVTAEQLDDRSRVGDRLATGSSRSAELMRAVFGSDTPSIESYMSSRHELVAA